MTVAELIGLVILSTAVGHEFSRTIGFAVLGAGMMLFPIVRAVFLRWRVR